jgi:hypothetical protein
MLAIAAVHIVAIVIGVPLIIVGLLVTAWINDWMNRGKRWS